jgi:F420-dependent oxidoreductase-like protein
MQKIRFSIALNTGWRRELPKDKTPSQQYQILSDCVNNSEKLGYDSAWLFDHLQTYPIPSDDSFFECWTLLTALASSTKRLRLGQMVMCNNLRSPSVLAKMAATLDNISNGRLEVGLGACWGAEELPAFGYEFPSPKIRLDMLEEAVQVMKLMLGQSPATFNGKYYRIKEAVNEPKPIQTPHPPITIGGAGPEKTLRIVAKYADKCNFGALRYHEEYVKGFRILEKYCSEYRRASSAIEKTCLREVVLAESEKELARKKSMLQQEDGHLTNRTKAYSENRVVGTAEECAETLSHFRDLGVTLFIVYFRDLLETDVQEIFMKKVAMKLGH